MANDKRKRALKRGLTPLAAVALLTTLVVSAGGTLAWLTTRTEAVTNTFTPAAPSIKVEESFDNKTKSNVKIENTGEVESYIRVALIPTWQNDKGNPVGVPASLSDLTITWGADEKGTERNPGANWIKGDDGYWYYTQPVAALGETDILIEEVKVPVTSKNGMIYHMNLQVLADAIQAEPAHAVTDTWGVTLDASGNITGQGGSAS